MSVSSFAQKAPDFTFTDTENRSWNLYESLSNNKVVVLDLFFADCGPCQTLSPALEEIYQSYGAGEENVLIFGISDRDDNNRLKAFDDDFGTTYPSAGFEGGGDTITELFQSLYPFVGWPTYAVICNDGTIDWNISKSNNLEAIPIAVDHCLTTNIESVSNQNAKLYYSSIDKSIHVSGVTRYSQLSLYNLQGAMFFKLDLEEGKAAVSVEDIPKGFYFLSIKSKNHISTHKINIH